jgi:hypothetical protein
MRVQLTLGLENLWKYEERVGINTCEVTTSLIAILFLGQRQ